MQRNDADLERALQRLNVEVPDDFTDQVMMRVVEEAPFDVAPRSSRHGLKKAAIALAFTAGGLLGVTQALSFAFGVWVLTAAG